MIDSFSGGDDDYDLTKILNIEGRAVDDILVMQPFLYVNSKLIVVKQGEALKNIYNSSLNLCLQMSTPVLT